MRTQISFHNIEKASQPGLEASIYVLARRHVERYLSRFPSGAVELHVHLEKSRHRDYYRVSMQLAVEGHTLASGQEGYDLMAALRNSFDELERELLRHIARLRQDEMWRRKERREELRRLKQAIDANPATGAQAFGELVRLRLPDLQRYVQREVAALRARGDLDPGFPASQDIVDEVLARAYQRLGERPKDLDPLHWLYQVTHEVLGDEVRKFPKERPRGDTLDEQDQDVSQLWLPDAMTLKPGDVEPATEQTPETNLEEQELRKYFHDALARMPNNWRRAIWLTQAEGIPVAKVALMMGASEQEVKRWIEQGDEYVRALLREADYAPGQEGKPPAWFVPTPTAATGLLEALDEVMKGAK